MVAGERVVLDEHYISSPACVPSDAERAKFFQCWSGFFSDLA